MSSSEVRFPDNVEDFILDEATPASQLENANNDFKVFLTEVADEERFHRIAYSCVRLKAALEVNKRDLNSFVADCCGTIIDLSDSMAASQSNIELRDSTIASFTELLDLVDTKCSAKDLYVVYVGGLNYVKKQQAVRLRCLKGLIRALGRVNGSTRAKFIAASLPNALTSVFEIDAQARGESELVGVSTSISRPELVELVTSLCVDNLAPSAYTTDQEKDPHSIGRFTVAAFLTNLISYLVRTTTWPYDTPQVQPPTQVDPATQRPTPVDIDPMAVISADPRVDADSDLGRIWKQLTIMAHCAAHVHPHFTRAIETQSALNANDDASGDLDITPVGLALVVWILAVYPDKEELLRHSNASPIPLVWSSYRLMNANLKAARVLLQEGSGHLVRPAVELVAKTIKTTHVAIKQFPANFANVLRLPCEPHAIIANLADGLASVASLSQSYRIHAFKTLTHLFSPLQAQAKMYLYAAASQYARNDQAAGALLDQARAPALEFVLGSTQEQSRAVTEVAVVLTKALFDSRTRIPDSVDRLSSGLTTLKLILTHQGLDAALKEKGTSVKAIIKRLNPYTPSPYSIVGQDSQALPNWLRQQVKNVKGPQFDSAQYVKHQTRLVQLEEEEANAAKRAADGPTTLAKEVEKVALELGPELQEAERLGEEAVHVGSVPLAVRLRLFSMLLADVTAQL